MRPISWLGVAFILLGVALILIPAIGRNLSPEDVPSWLLYVYKSGNFYFVTSPVLILLSILIFLLRFWQIL